MTSNNHNFDTGDMSPVKPDPKNPVIMAGFEGKRPERGDLSFTEFLMLYTTGARRRNDMAKSRGYQKKARELME